MPHSTDTVIVGGGQAGLSLAHHLARLRQPHVVLERGRVGERWLSERWDSLTLLTPNWLNRLDGGPEHAHAEAFLGRLEFARYLREYARGASIREHVDVRAVEPRSGGGFRVATDDSEWLARNVVVATGDAAEPFVPAAPAATAPARLHQLHSSEYRNPGQLREGGALVVGAGPSGQQIAAELRRSGRDVVLAVGRHARALRRYRGLDIWRWLDLLGDLERFIDACPDPEAARRTPNLALSGTNGGEQLDLDVLQRLGVAIVGRVERFEGGNVHLARDLNLQVAAADQRLQRLLSRIDGYVDEALPHWPHDADAVRPVHIEEQPPAIDLAARGIDSVIWATGYRRDDRWVHAPVTGADGELVHRYGFTGISGLAVLGRKFQRRRSSHFIGRVGADAALLARWIEKRGRVAAAIAAALLVAASSVGEAAAKRPRPNAAPGAQTSIAPNGLQLYNEYTSPERQYASERVVVHYVTAGIDAPPLNDDDAGGVPDYVERVGEAADEALAYYSRRGFHAPLPDDGGPDSRPDVYISRFAPGTLGVAFPAVNADGGAFVVVANNLDPSAETSFASVYGTVAHELFHLVQFSYFGRTAEPAIPTWILEGTASAIEARVYPDLDDIVTSLQLRRWFSAPEAAITEQSYGAQLLWQSLDREQPRLLPALFRRLAERPDASDGRAAVATTFAHVGGTPFPAAFDRFAVEAVADHGEEIEPLFALPPHTSRSAVVAPLAVHYLQPVLPRVQNYSLTVAFPRGRGSASATLTYELDNEIPGRPPSMSRIRGRWSARGRRLTFGVPRAVRRNPRLALPRLVVSNGGLQPVAYTVSAR